MPRKQLSFEQRQAKILEIAQTEYRTDLEAADAYLAIMEGASVEDQVCLFESVLTLHDVVRYKRHRCPKDWRWKEKQLRPALERLADMVFGWSRTALQANAPAADTAKMLWDRLTLCEAGEDRVVALAILLRSQLVPYARISPDLLLLKPKDVYDDAYDRVTSQIALLKRVECSGVTALELAEAFVRVLEQTEGHDERVAILNCFFSYMQARLQRGKEAQSLIGELGDFLFRSVSHDHDEEGEQEDEESEG